MTIKRDLTCTCCGGSAGRWQQWPNQDTGYGLCPHCRDWIWKRNQPSLPNSEFIRTYGKPGVNYEAFPAGHPLNPSTNTQEKPCSPN